MFRAVVELELDGLDRRRPAGERPGQLGGHLLELPLIDLEGLSVLAAEIDRGVLAADPHLPERLGVRGEPGHRRSGQPPGRILQQRLHQTGGELGVGGLLRHEHGIGHQRVPRLGQEVEVARLVYVLEVGIGQQQPLRRGQAIDPPLTVDADQRENVRLRRRPRVDLILAGARDRRHWQPGHPDLGTQVRLVRHRLGKWTDGGRLRLASHHGDRPPWVPRSLRRRIEVLLGHLMVPREAGAGREKAVHDLRGLPA